MTNDESLTDLTDLSKLELPPAVEQSREAYRASTEPHYDPLRAPLLRIALAMESLLPELTAVMPTRLPLDVSPALLMMLEELTRRLGRIAEALERAYPDPDSAPRNISFLMLRDGGWVLQNMADEGRLKYALWTLMQNTGERGKAPYRHLYDVYQKGAVFFQRQHRIGHRTAMRMRELFAEWGVDGDAWWVR